MAASIKVTVIINVHNGEKFLMDAVTSVLSQKFSNFELLIWNNCSTDSTDEIIQRAMAEDQRVHSHKTPAKTSLYEARNDAIALSKGEFVAFLDSDDLWRNDKLSTALSTLDDMGAQVFFSNFEIWDWGTNSRRVAYKADLPRGLILNQLACNYTVALSTLVFRKSVLGDFDGPFNPEYSIIGDYDLVLRLAERHEFASSNLPLTTYRVHDSNLSKLAIDERKSEIETWSKTAPLSKSADKRTYLMARASLMLDAVFAENSPPVNKLLGICRLLITPRFVVLLISKLSWWASNNRKNL